MAGSEQYSGMKDHLTNDEMVGRADIALERAFREAGSEKYKGKTSKLFGFFEVPAAMGVAIEALTNEMLGMVQGIATPWTFNKLKELSTEQLGHSQTTAAKVAAIGAFATSAAIRSSTYVTGVYQTMRENYADSKKAAKDIAPVLDTLKGSHSLLAFMSVKQSDNAMIYAHHKRMKLIANNKTNNQLIKWAANAGINMLPQFAILAGVARGKSPAELQELVARAAETQDHDPKKPATVSKGTHQHTQDMLLTRLRTMGAPMVAEGLISANNNTLKELDLGEFSALQMVTYLEDQVTNNPQDKSFKLPGNKGREVPLEQYIMAVMKQYQADLAAIDPQEAQLRETLLEDLKLVAKPMAEAIRKGQMGALGLVELIGGGHVIKGHGRVVASADEVAAEIERMGGQERKAHRSAKDYYANHGYDGKQLKEALSVLKKDAASHDDYVLLASWHSDEVLEDAGISSGEIKKIRAEIRDHYVQRTLDLFRGAVSMDAEELHALGLPTAEANKLLELKKYIEKHGADSFSELLESPTNPHGVEGLLADLVVPNTKVHGALYMGDLIAKGKVVSEHSHPHHEQKRDASKRDVPTSSHAERQRERSHAPHSGERHA